MLKCIGIHSHTHIYSEKVTSLIIIFFQAHERICILIQDYDIFTRHIHNKYFTYFFNNIKLTSYLHMIQENFKFKFLINIDYGSYFSLRIF